MIVAIALLFLNAVPAQETLKDPPPSPERGKHFFKGEPKGWILGVYLGIWWSQNNKVNVIKKILNQNT